MKRVLVITNRYPCDADDPASPFVPHFVHALSSCGLGVEVLTPRYTHRPPCVEPDYIHRFHTGASSPVGSWNLMSPANWIRLRKFVAAGHDLGRQLCRKNHYDHILALWALPSGEFANRLSKEFKIPYSTWCLGSDIYSWARRPVIKGQIARVLRESTHVFADGYDLCERVKNWLGIECRFLPSFRPLDGALPDLPPGANLAPRYLYLGRLHSAKGTSELLDAFRTVAEKLPSATLSIVGDGPDLARLRNQAQQLCLGDAVSFAGSVGRNEITAAYRQCDFVVIPTKSDSLPLVFSEAIQARRPVIGTDVGDLGAFIRRFHVGIVCDAAEPALLSAAMIRMADQPIFSTEGRERLLKLLDPKVAAMTFCTGVFGAQFAPVEPAPPRGHIETSIDDSVAARL